MDADSIDALPLDQVGTHQRIDTPGNGNGDGVDGVSH
jgi:hypothetical protein